LSWDQKARGMGTTSLIDFHSMN